MREGERARAIVKLAAAEGTSASEWLLRDERGTWEKEAATLLEATAERAARMGLSPAEHDAAVAARLALLALDAMLAHERKREARRTAGLAHASTMKARRKLEVKR